MAIRFFSLISFLGILYGILAFQFYHLQVQKRDYYFNRAEARSEILSALSLRRGSIFATDRNGTAIPVALNKDFPVIYAVPKEIDDPQEEAQVVATLLGLDAKNFLTAFSNRNSLFKLLVEKATPEQIDAVKQTDLKGIYTDQKQYRVYPFETLAANLIGFLGKNETHDEAVGLYGTEKLYEKKLKQGDTIQLSIDLSLETQAEKILSRLIQDYGATGGTIIIQNPQTGKILTLANKPDFDPNSYQKYAIGNFINPAVQYVYESGSVFKPITMAVGIETGAITPDTTFVDKGSVTLNGKTIKNAGGKIYGKVTMTNVIEHSINTGAVFASQKVGRRALLDYFQKFGFGSKTGIEVPDEVVGDLRTIQGKNAQDVDFATASFGQGTAVTPIQMINAFSVLANGGLLMRPSILQDSKPVMVRRVVSEETTRKVIAMMESTVEKAGVASIPQFTIAGKTGTALIPDFKKGGYSDELVHTFVGMVPASRPQAVILIKLDKPKVGELAGITVVPAFKELAQFFINYKQIPPDTLPESMNTVNSK